MEDFGLAVFFDSKEYIVIGEEITKKYRIGEIACEYSRLNRGIVKKIILENPFNDEPITPEAAYNSIKWVEEQFTKKLKTATARMVLTEIYYTVDEYFTSGSEFKKNFFNVINETIDKSLIYKTLAGSKYDSLEGNHVGQLLLAACAEFFYSYALFDYSFKVLVTDGMLDKKECNEEAIRNVISLFTDHLGGQEIGYKIVLHDGRFKSLYLIKSSISLALFELAHIIENSVIVKKCRNCGQYFVPEGRSDTIYCNEIADQNHGKTCKEIGAQILRSKKEKADVTTKEYRRIYAKTHMQSKRHPDNKQIIDKLQRLRTEAKIYRSKLEKGEINAEQFLEWVRGFE